MTNVALSIRNLTRDFGSFRAVDSLSFDVFRHEVFGFLGPNGAGKTTTISMICGLLPASEGSISFQNYNRLQDSGSPKETGRRPDLGYCPQENIFWPRLTCREQLIFMAEMYGLRGHRVKERADRMLELMGLTAKSKVLAAKLSGGMKRRLSISLALMHDPQILILDEPEAGLDPQSRILVREFILSFARQKTILLTTHNMDEAEKLSDRVAIIDQGKLLMLDTPENLKKTIGEGDLLELRIENCELGMKDQIRSKLSALCDSVVVTEDMISLRSLNMLEKIPEISAAISSAGMKIGQMSLRENTLEDVFIHLTGRRLRS